MNSKSKMNADMADRKSQSRISTPPSAELNPYPVALLLLASGLCALIYQVVWLREFRLIFGGATASTGAVLAIFMAGLGLGNAIVGRWADRVTKPLKVYAILELGIALTALLSPWLIDLSRQLYTSLGGQATLGFWPATLVRLALASVVLLIPTMLMGGTLPVAAKAATSRKDIHRKSLAIVYGFNTLGAVVGTLLTTFLLLENLGITYSLFFAVVMNLGVSTLAWSLSSRYETPIDEPSGSAERSPVASESSSLDPQFPDIPSSQIDAWLNPSTLFIYFSAATLGFVFFVMEQIWFRMLAPLLGGTTYTFGIILSVALLGIGLGSLIHQFTSFMGRRQLFLFSIACGLEAAFLALPIMLGDRIAIWTVLLRPTEAESIAAFLPGWFLISALVVFPVSVISGLQFPLLISLLGDGRSNLSSQTGYAFAANTLGAILGSLVGGFGIIPLLGAVGAWQLMTLLIALLGVLSIWKVLLYSPARRQFALPVLLALYSQLNLFFIGPTPAWRHSSIGAGRNVAAEFTNPNDTLQWLYAHRDGWIYEEDGQEASLGINTRNSLAFYINGKSDGSSVGDAATQIMSTLVGAVLHPDPKNCLVIGLGTGESAGWLAQVPGIENVDVAEMEPAVDNMARLCSEINWDVMNNPRVNRIYTDGREILLTSQQKYDIIFSEPSNPYRIGVANLWTHDFYQAAKRKIKDDGYFIQWLQGYEVDIETIWIVINSFRRVFPEYEIWKTLSGDLLLIGSPTKRTHDLESIRQRLQFDVVQQAMAATWYTHSLEGFLSHFVAGNKLHESSSNTFPDLINTDDRNLLEYGFAKSLGKKDLLIELKLRNLAVELNDSRARVSSAEQVDWQLVYMNYIGSLNDKPKDVVSYPLDEKGRQDFKAFEAFDRNDFKTVTTIWHTPELVPDVSMLKLIAAFSYAMQSDEKALEFLAPVESQFPHEANCVRLTLFRSQKKYEQAVASLVSTLEYLHKQPWLHPIFNKVLIDYTKAIASERPELCAPFLKLLLDPFAVYFSDIERLYYAIDVAAVTGDYESLSKVFRQFEPNPIWEEHYLSLRYKAYETMNDPLAAKAYADYQLFLKQK